jgi:SCY1-like protein 1
MQLGSVFVNTAGEWKVGGLEFVSGSEASLFIGKVPSLLNQLDSPEVKSGGKGGSKWSADAWGLGILIWEIFNGPIHQISSLRSPGKIPKALVTTFNELVSENAAGRPNPADVIARGRRPGGFYKNDLVDSLLFLEEIQIKELNEKTRFFNGLASVLDKFPEDICRYKILPQLLNAFEFGNAGSSVLTPMFKVILFFARIVSIFKL